MNLTKKQAAENRKAVREYWRSYLADGHIMAWLLARDNGDVYAIYEPQGQTYYTGHDDVLHYFGDVYRAHGQMPEHVTFSDFLKDNDLIRHCYSLSEVVAR